MELDTILSAICAPLKLPSFQNNTQGVERMIRAVCEAATKRVGHLARGGLILKLLESRTLIPRFNTKKHAAKF